MVVGRLLSYWEGNFSGAQKKLPTKKIVYSVDINQHDGMTVVLFIRCGAAGVAMKTRIFKHGICISREKTGCCFFSHVFCSILCGAVRKGSRLQQMA